MLMIMNIAKFGDVLSDNVVGMVRKIVKPE